MAVEQMPGFVRVDHAWTAEERLALIRYRFGNHGPRTRVAPGLYALGAPDRDSPVVVTASCRPSFDLLRRDLAETSCWLLVLDTRGLDVASAAAAGRFSSDELASRILSSRLTTVVRHRTVILPARAAAAVEPPAVLAATGFAIQVGPERSSGLRRFLLGEPLPQPEAPAPRLSPVEALALTPVEIGRALAWFPAFAFAVLIFSGLGPTGVELSRALDGSWPLLVLGIASAFCGSLLAPMIYSVAPGLPLWAAGAAAALAATAGLMEGAGLAQRMNGWLQAGAWMFFPGAAAGIAQRFEGALPSSVPPPPRAARWILPSAAVALGALTAAALVLSKSSLWRVGR